MHAAVLHRAPADVGIEDAAPAAGGATRTKVPAGLRAHRRPSSSVSNACEIAPVLTEENAAALLDAVTHQPKLQVRRIVLAAKRPAPSRQSVPTEKQESEASAEPSTAPAADVSLSELCGVALPDTGLTEHAPAPCESTGARTSDRHAARRARTQLVLTDEEFAAFKKAQDLLAHVVRNGDPAGRRLRSRTTRRTLEKRSARRTGSRRASASRAVATFPPRSAGPSPSATNTAVRS